MLSRNPFAELSAFVPPAIMQTYIVAMILMVAGGTLFDIMHKKSAKYFFDHWRNAKNKGTRQVGGGEMVSLAMQTGVVEGLTSGEALAVAESVGAGEALVDRHRPRRARYRRADDRRHRLRCYCRG